jgi:hypothetical protein
VLNVLGALPHREHRLNDALREAIGQQPTSAEKLGQIGLALMAETLRLIRYAWFDPQLQVFAHLEHGLWVGSSGQIRILFSDPWPHPGQPWSWPGDERPLAYRAGFQQGESDHLLSTLLSIPPPVNGRIPSLERAIDRVYDQLHPADGKSAEKPRTALVRLVP